MMQLICDAGFRMTEFLDHLHEHMEAPTVMDKGSYKAPIVSKGPKKQTKKLPAEEIRCYLMIFDDN